MISRHPWIFIVLAFLILIGAWVTLITLAVKNAPDSLEAPNQQSHDSKQETKPPSHSESSSPAPETSLPSP